MATIKLQGNASGSGSVTLTAPNTNSARTITLPDQDVDLGSLGGAGTVKAWINFQGSGTVTIRQNGNVSSISDNGSGDYTISFSNAISTNTFMYNHGGRRVVNNFNESAINMGIYGSGNWSTTSNRFLTYDNNSDNRFDPEIATLSVVN